ncbi:MAG TPA: hypothetical protein VJ583_05155 [Nitrososphaeraceae archaeon]|nr:hypothetical protein [Nitrososphaeraceae archaeon]
MMATTLFPSEFIYLLTVYYTGALIVSIVVLLVTIKKNRFEGEYQLYARILDARTRLQNTDIFTRMAKESSLYAERFKLVEEPKEYYTIISLIDTIEFIYRINKKKMIDKELWQRWENHAKSMMTIPKFHKIWSATREFHTRDFVNFMDDL